MGIEETEEEYNLSEQSNSHNLFALADFLRGARRRPIRVIAEARRFEAQIGLTLLGIILSESFSSPFKKIMKLLP